jgi:hypothetical protein
MPGPPGPLSPLKGLAYVSREGVFLRKNLLKVFALLKFLITLSSPSGPSGLSGPSGHGA